jgi:adenine-specific DNA-methyltransferase
VPYRPLVPQADKSVGAPDLAGNLIIHGDNLHALKSLLPRYAGAVDLVFIDPPTTPATKAGATATASIRPS